MLQDINPYKHPYEVEQYESKAPLQVHVSAIWHYRLALMSIYECTMVDTERAYSRCKVYKC